MKKILCVLIFVMFGCCSCASLRTERGIQENVFYSTNPELAVKIGSDFDYAKKESQKGSHVGDGHVGVHGSDEYIFADTFDHRIVVINITRLGSRFYFPDVVSEVDTPLDSGIVQHGDYVYKYVVFAHEDNKRVCHLVKKIARTAGVRSNEMVNVVYAEQLKGNEPQCEEWQDKSALNASQKARLQTFLSRSKKAVEFVDITEVNIPVQ